MQTTAIWRQVRKVMLGKSMELTKKMFDLAIDSEVNCMDLYSPDPELRSRIGTVLNGRRERFILQAHLCTVWRDGQYKRTRDPAETQESFEELLRRLGTDYIDIGMIHYVDSPKEWKALSEGKIRTESEAVRKNPPDRPEQS
mgnify:CR=1 FL=1